MERLLRRCSIPSFPLLAMVMGCAYIKGEKEPIPISEAERQELNDAYVEIDRWETNVRARVMLEKLLPDIRACVKPIRDYDRLDQGELVVMGGLANTPLNFIYQGIFSLTALSVFASYNSETDQVRIEVVPPNGTDADIAHCGLTEWTDADDVHAEAELARRRVEGQIIKQFIALLAPEDVRQCLALGFQEEAIEALASRVIDDDAIAGRIADVANSLTVPEDERTRDLVVRTLKREFSDEYPELIPLLEAVEFVDCLLEK